MEKSPINNSPPPWETLPLIAQYLDPKTLAMASSVSKSWFSAMSSDHLWLPFCSADFPSLCSLPAVAGAGEISGKRIYSLGCAAAAARRRQAPAKPRISVADIEFAVTVTAVRSGEELVSVFRSCSDLAGGEASDGVFVFDLSEANARGGEVGEGSEEVRVWWSVVLENWRGVFTMMECGGKVSAVAGAEGWFSAELPLPECCVGSASPESGIVADLKIGFGGGEGEREVRVEKVSVGMLSVVNWRYVNVEDALRYLQHFLLPPSS